MTIIADCGGTKIEWSVIDGTRELKRFFTPGMNAMMLSAEEMEKRFGEELAPELEGCADKIDKAFFYGAGCVSNEVCNSVARALSTVMPNAKVEVASDLLGCARALCGHEAGVACILGTGSNSCYYDGEKIVENVSPLGFILGDEGGGAYMGKSLVSNYLKHLLPPEISAKFAATYPVDVVTVVNRVYRQPMPNKYLASFTPFLKENLEHPAMRKIVYDAFCAFFKRNVCYYPTRLPLVDGKLQKLKVNFTGSVSFHFRDVLEQVTDEFGFVTGIIESNPMNGLIKYHM